MGPFPFVVLVNDLLMNKTKVGGNSNKILPKKNKSKRAVKLSKGLKNSSSLTTVTHGGGNMMV